MMEPTLTFSLFGLAIYPYGLAVAAAALLGCLTLVLVWGKGAQQPLLGLRFTLYAIPACVLLARLGYCALQARFIAVDYAPGFLFHLDWGGYSLAGASLGLGLAGLVFARVTRRPFAQVMDFAMPAALLTLSVARLAERFTLDGVGGYVEDWALQHFPFALPDAYGDYVMPVFLWEAAVALILTVVILRVLLRHKKANGDATLLTLLLVGLSQIFLESLRQDSFLRFGFVRVNQLWGLLLVVYAIGYWLGRAKPSLWRALAVTVGVLGCLAVLILVEFGLDKSTVDNGLLYGILAVTLGVLAAIGLALRARYPREVVQ